MVPSKSSFIKSRTVYSWTATLLILCSPAAHPKRVLNRVAALMVAAVSRKVRRFMAWKLMIAFLQGAPLKRKLNPRALYAPGEIRVLKRYCKLGKTHPRKNKRGRRSVPQDSDCATASRLEDCW